MRYWIDGRVHNLSNLSDSEVHALLKPFHHEKAEHIFCGCRHTLAADVKLPMYVRQNKATLGLARAPRSGNDHHRACRHFDPTPQDAARLGYDSGVLGVDAEGNALIALSESLRNSTGATEPQAGTFNLGPRDMQRRTVSRMTLLGLLHLMWERAGLNRHNNAVPVSLPEALRRLRYTARHIRLKHMRGQWGIDDHVLLPDVTGFPTGRANFAKTRAAAEADKKVLALAVINSPAEMAALVDVKQRPSLKSMLHVAVRGDAAGKTLEDLLQPKHARALTLFHAGARLVVLALAGTKTYEGTPYAVIEKLATMAVTPAWIPVESSHEFELALHLVVQGRRFEKPLRYDASELVFPDFVLEDTARPVPIEVYGMGTLASYAQRQTEKRFVYQEVYPGRHWEWDVQQNSRLPEWLRLHPLPPAEFSR